MTVLVLCVIVNVQTSDFFLGNSGNWEMAGVIFIFLMYKTEWFLWFSYVKTDIQNLISDDTFNFAQ